MKHRTSWLWSGLGLALFGLWLAWGLSGTPIEAAPTAQEGYINVVAQPGDSLVVYRRVFGVSAHSIIAVNNFKDPNLIYVGQTVVIPVNKSYEPSLTTPFYYVVQPGDQLYALARQFSQDPSVIMRANRMVSPTLLAGQTIIMPAGPHVHYVAKGETLKIIAARFGVTVQFLLTGNTLPNPDLIYVGQPIAIPIIYNAQPVPLSGASGIVATATPPAAATRVPNASRTPVGPAPTSAPLVAVPTMAVAGDYFVVTVKSGDSFLKYSQWYGVTGYKLRVANSNILTPSLIFAGQTVVVPVVASYLPSRTTPFYYVVQQNDTQESIARKFEMTTETLLKPNNGVSFAVGATLLIPAGPHLYTIRGGETLAHVAMKYGTTIDFLLTGNRLPDPNAVFTGQQIYVPLQFDMGPMPFD